MISIDLIKACSDSIRQVSHEISGSVVYVDAGCLEVFQTFDALLLLLELGAHAVFSLENASSSHMVADKNCLFRNAVTKIVIFTSHLLNDAHRYILHCLKIHQSVLLCTIYTSISETAHAACVDSPLGPDAFHEYKTLLFQDYDELLKKSKDYNDQMKSAHATEPKEKNYQRGELETEVDWSWGDADIPTNSISTAQETDELNSSRFAEMVIAVHHFPMIFGPVCPRVFVLPFHGAISEACLSYEHEYSLSPRLPPLSTGLTFDGDDIPSGAVLTAHFLYHLVAKMDMKMEIFSAGDMSKCIGKILTDMSSLYDVGRRNRRSIGLLLIDRSLDLISPCSHGDSLVDQILSSLPCIENTSSLRHMNKNVVRTDIQLKPLSIDIPFDKIKEDLSIQSRSIKAFISGWDSFDSDTISVNSKGQMDFDVSLLNGSLVCSDNYQGVPFLEALFERNIKDGALLIKKWVEEALLREKLTLNSKSLPGVVTPTELGLMAKLLCSNEKSLLKNKGIIQLALAAEIALSEPHYSRWTAFVSAQRILRLNAEETSQSLSSYIADLINKSSLMKNSFGSSEGDLFSFKDALVLAIIGYLLAGDSFAASGSDGPFPWEEERFLKEAIIDAIMENPAATKLKFLDGLKEEVQANLMRTNNESSSKSTFDDFDDKWGSWDDEEMETNDDHAYGDVQLKLKLRDRVDQVLKVFHKLSGSKRRSPIYKDGLSLVEATFNGDSFQSLLFKLLTLILGDYDVPGLTYHSSAVGRFLKSGFGRFGLGQAKPKLGEQDVLLVFFVGGISCLEVREALEALARSGRPNIELILGGTALVTPDDMFDMLMDSSSFVYSS